ncbi:MAG: hypothetical protein WCT14_09045 [Treponemataceae bacterium]
MKGKLIALGMVLALVTGTAFAQTATKYFVAHQGGYIGEATVSVDKAGKVTAASIVEWQGPGGWAENNSPDGKAIVDGAIVRVPDPMANLGSSDPEIKGYMFYIYNQVEKGPSAWSQFTPGKTGFVRPGRQWERDFEGMMSNPIRSEAYAKAAKADTLVNVKIEGLKVTVGKKASETIHYGHMNKADKNSVYMALGADGIGYRYNNKAMLDFFKAHPMANFAAATMKKAKVTVKEDKNIDAKADVSKYVAAEDTVYVVADAVTGATYSDYQHYSLELQAAYKLALADQVLKAKK